MAATLDLVEKVCEEDFPFLGICLGAQMLAKAAGGNVVSGSQKEIDGSPFKSTRKVAACSKGGQSPPSYFTGMESRLSLYDIFVFSPRRRSVPFRIFMSETTSWGFNITLS